MVLGEGGVVAVSVGVRQGRVELVVVDIRDAFEEEQREDVSLEVGSINGPAKDVRGLPWCDSSSSSVQNRS